ncbi:glyoxylate/hydroxypyruvate reductase B [Komagataeibacter europaeus]|uniref:Glyoxylate/hydroxypyruvate reductase B n=1 Tax=Komagataeibacter europaeus TaxID=33995 RepID=A0A0M0EJ52_KOMEU|nr:2-hydroxyacid dehydrogenase [Komagataeibacter europaeus]KON65285.1 glyoxylate/hydroxypyruvate reductase B [Komagataeibacter europaeus]GBQ41616.1 D-isomer-specific 2-hydroxyacid dehydrogenase [Komagataeibacter europaeus LMG 18890]
MKPDILLLEPMMPEIEKQLDAAYTVHRPIAGEPLDKIAGLIRGIATGGGTGVPRAVMDSLPHLEIIAINGIGTDAVDLNEAKRRGIHVTTTPGVLTDDVADMAMGLLLSLLRGLPAADRYVRDGGWGRRPAPPLGHRVSGRRLGILGMGHVGQAVATRASAFGMPVSYTDRRDKNLPGYTFVPELPTLARNSDVLVVAASGGAGSRHLVNRQVLDALGPDGVLVNVARGSVVDETALVAALADGTLGGAGLDVFEHEPDVPEGLRTSSRTVLQPHRASATVETRMAMGKLVVENLAAHFAGRPLLTPVV